ncbi:hypothetical protein JCM33374_g2448 [Metschnikowia sp. JCM 33374]|nr:hypothetical protein JCM33374_g2448 [Metschnikowia sp. JCM 33374]
MLSHSTHLRNGDENNSTNAMNLDSRCVYVNAWVICPKIGNNLPQSLTSIGIYSKHSPSWTPVFHILKI